jgi:ubiquinone/menaquinone biosynthesis C-methylase UbiE
MITSGRLCDGISSYQNDFPERGNFMSDKDQFPQSGMACNEEDRQQAVTRNVKAFYERFRFPGHRPMEQDSLIFYRKFSLLIAARSSAGRPLRVLDAGCGTGNTSLALAARFPGVEFTSMDLSSQSIAQARSACTAQDLKNLRFYEWNLLEPLAYERLFDIVLCFSALHLGFKSLGDEYKVMGLAGYGATQ